MTGLYRGDTGLSCAERFYTICVRALQIYDETETLKEELENGKDRRKLGGPVCERGMVGGGAASYLGAVVKPPEEGQCSAVTWPNHCSQISLFPPNGYNRNGEIYTLHWTWGNNITHASEFTK